MLFFVLLAGVGAGLANLLGIYLIRKYLSVTEGYVLDVIAFAAGLVIGIAWLHFIPEVALHMPQMLPWALLSFFVLYVVEHHFAPHFHSTHEQTETKPLGIITSIGFGVHSIFDGLAIGVGFAFDAHIGAVAALAILVHEIPEGIATYATLAHSGHTPQQANKYASFVALITPLVAVASYFMGVQANEEILGILLALATGSLVYIGATDLLPEVAHTHDWKKTVLIILGAVVAFLLTLLGSGH